MWDRMLRTLGSPAAVGLLVGTVVTMAVVGIRVAGYLELWELKVYDWLLRTQPPTSPTEPRIVLIGVTERDVQRLGRWPFTDGLLAQVLEALLAHQPRAIGVDFYRNFPVPPGHQALESLLNSHPNVIMVMKFGGDTLANVPPPPILNDTDQVGFNDLLIDEDGVVRRGLLFLDDGQHTVYSFALRLALKYLEPEGVFPQPDRLHPEHLRLGQSSLRPLEPNDGGYVGVDARGYQFLLDFDGEPPSLQTYSVSDLLAGRITSEALKDKIVILGATAESVPDLFHTPYRSGLGADQRGMYGVVVHAHLVSQLLRAALAGAEPRKSPGETHEVVWTFMWGLLGGVTGTVSRSTWRFAVFVVGGLGLLLVIVWSAFWGGWWIPSLPPALAYVASTAVLTAAIVGREKLERAQLMQLFSRHVSPEVAEQIWQQRELFWDGGRPRPQKLTVTVLFSDLEGFTPAAEQMDPQRLMSWMNTYIETMAHLVMQHGGVVDDYFGDAIKANFGVPLARTMEEDIAHDARNAVRCALAMEAELRRLNQLWHAQHLPTARMRIGIFTGQAVAGSLGSAERLKYTTIGDTVNIAARLESFQKDAWESGSDQSSCRILIGDSTVRYLDPALVIRPLGEMSLRGKTFKVTVYQLIGRADHVASHAHRVTLGG
ncbi:MAG: adenylate/guanylate cyclase domain-containing protein [Nitrospirota bacterium]